jgi:hypothetical protein
MVTQFDTSGLKSGSGSSTTKWLLIGLALAIAGYGYYKFVYLPKQEKEEGNKENA